MQENTLVECSFVRWFKMIIYVLKFLYQFGVSDKQWNYHLSYVLSASVVLVDLAVERQANSSKLFCNYNGVFKINILACLSCISVRFNVRRTLLCLDARVQLICSLRPLYEIFKTHVLLFYSAAGNRSCKTALAIAAGANHDRGFVRQPFIAK